MEPSIHLFLLLTVPSVAILLLLLSYLRRRTSAVGNSKPLPLPSPATDKGEGAESERKRKKKARRRKVEAEVVGEIVGEKGSAAVVAEVVTTREGEGFPYPFSSCSSSTQRRIKLLYDELVRSNEAKALTVAQVAQFINCLVEARNDLQQKSQVIHRKFTIAKALLCKADRPSFCRLCQQIHKLEVEQKRLEEDAVVYNRIQQQLKLSPAFKTMLEIGARMEAEADSDQSAAAADSDFTDISFEELLAREKQDSFWKKNGKWRSCAE